MSVRIAAMVFMLSASCYVLAQQDESSQEQQIKPEEMLIIGGRSLRLQLMETEKKAYEAFNKFNDDKRFNISCSMNKPTGSHFEKQICQPKFEIEAMNAHALDYLDGMPGRLAGLPIGSIAPTHAPMEAEITRQQLAYKHKIKQIAEQHPEFLEAIIQYSKVWEQYEKATSTAGK